MKRVKQNLMKYTLKEISIILETQPMAWNTHEAFGRIQSFVESYIKANSPKTVPNDGK